MKRSLTYSVILLCVLLTGCAKVAVQEPWVDDFADAPWAADPTMKVPVLFNMGGTSFGTKAAIEDIEDVQFGVLAVDVGETAREGWADNDDWQILLRGKAAYAHNGQATFIERSGENVVPVNYYYPLETFADNDPAVEDRRYAFFGYRTSDAQLQDSLTVFDLDFDGSHFTKTVQIDTTDVLWAAAYCDTLYNSESTAWTLGFSSDFSRTARKWYPSAWMSYMPTLRFSHLTAALHFKLFAADAEAEASFVGPDNEALVTVSDLQVSSLPTRATLDVLTGTLTAIEDTADTLSINGGYVMPTVTGVEYGRGLFIVPTTDDIYVSFTLNTPAGTYTPAEPYKVSLTGGFIAGKSYTFRIVVKSLESIVINVELQPWEPAENLSEEEALIANLG